MKKIRLLSISIILLIIFVSCSAAPGREEFVDFTDPLSYDMAKLDYQLLSNQDIYTYFQDDYRELIAILPKTTSFSLIEPSWNEIQGLLNKMSLVGTPLSITPFEMIHKTSSEFNTLASSQSVILTVDDIVTFNDLKFYLNDLTEIITIEKKELFAIYLDRFLTEEEILAFSSLQHYYSRLILVGEDISLKTISYEEIEVKLLLLTPAPSEEDLLNIERGLELIQNLII